MFIEVAMFFLKKYRITSKYKKYREAGKELNHKIIDRFIDRNIMLKSGKYLGLVKRDALIFNSKLESTALMDFAINEFEINGKNAIQLYKEKVMLENDIEGAILDALLKSYTTLCKITDIKRKRNKLILTDLLNINCEPIEIIDIGFSQSAPIGLLMFLRVVPFDDFKMTGGIGFIFYDDLEELLIKEYMYLSKFVKSSNESIKRYVAFFKLYRRHGIGTGFM
jgi:hypothetical protein